MISKYTSRLLRLLALNRRQIVQISISLVQIDFSSQLFNLPCICAIRQEWHIKSCRVRQLTGVLRIKIDICSDFSQFLLELLLLSSNDIICLFDIELLLLLLLNWTFKIVRIIRCAVIDHGSHHGVHVFGDSCRIGH